MEDVENTEQNEIMTLATLLAVGILFLYTISHPIFEKYKFYYIHESGLSMLIGILATMIVMLINPSVR
jgi:hypothetical protein